MEYHNAPSYNLDFPWFIVEYFNNKKLSESTKRIYKLEFRNY